MSAAYASDVAAPCEAPIRAIDVAPAVRSRSYALVTTSLNDEAHS